MKDEIIDLTAIDQKINALLYKAGYYLQCQRTMPEGQVSGISLD